MILPFAEAQNEKDDIQSNQIIETKYINLYINFGVRCKNILEDRSISWYILLYSACI